MGSNWIRRKDIMLCYPFEEKRLLKWKPPYIVQPKLDGDRCRAVIDKEGKSTLYSSEGNIITSVPHINHELDWSGLRSIELDGELYIHQVPHELIHGIVSRKVNISEMHEGIQFAIFDIINDEPQIARTNLMKCINYSDSIIPVLSDVAYNLDDIMHRMDIYVEDGYEGIIIRHTDALYRRSRSPYIMKFKPGRQDDYVIVGSTEEIDQYGTPKARLGALICIGDDGTRFNVGTGFTQGQRIDLWNNKETLIGKIATVKYQHMTHTNGVPRFPVFVTIT